MSMKQKRYNGANVRLFVKDAKGNSHEIKPIEVGEEGIMYEPAEVVTVTVKGRVIASPSSYRNKKRKPRFTEGGK